MIILIILVLSSTKNIENFTDKKETTTTTSSFIYNISCENTNNYLDKICDIYTTQLRSLSSYEHDYNSAKRNTQNKYDLWNFAKNEVDFKKSVLNNAIILNSKINIRNKIEKTLIIINAIIAAKKIVILLNSGYTQSTVAYKNALDEYNKIVREGNVNANGNEKILEINSENGYSSANEALEKTIEKYNNAVFIAIATNTEKSKNLMPSISKTTGIDVLINAQIAANDAYNEINDKYIIPSLNSYNEIAKEAKMKTYEITENLSLIQKNAEIAYEKSQKSEKTTIALTLSNYKNALNDEVNKLTLFYNEIKDLQTFFYNYCELLINPEIAYKSISDANSNSDPNAFDNYYCERYEILINELYKILPEVNKIKSELSILKEKSSKTSEFFYIEETKNNAKTIFDYFKKSYLTKLDNYKNEIININSSDDFLNKYIDLNTVNNLYYNSIISYNKTLEKQEYNKKVIDTLPIIQNYNNIKNNIKRCYPDG